jgi:hypothetical protein
MSSRSLSCVLVMAALLNACASVPKSNDNPLATDKVLESVSDEQGRRVSRFVDGALLAPLTAFALPEIKLEVPEARKDISTQQLAILSNALNRSVCDRLSQYLVAEPEPSPTALKIEIALTGITPTSKTISGISAAADFFVPGPFRIPVGMGAIALDARASTDGNTAAFMRWAKGANPVFNSAKVSSIGDAYDLVDTFTREFGQLLLQGTSKVKIRQKLPDDLIEANETLCESRYGKVDPIGKGASVLVPLPPEFIDKGKPDAEQPLDALN